MLDEFSTSEGRWSRSATGAASQPPRGTGEDPNGPAPEWVGRSGRSGNEERPGAGLGAGTSAVTLQMRRNGVRSASRRPTRAPLYGSEPRAWPTAALRVEEASGGPR